MITLKYASRTTESPNSRQCSAAGLHAGVMGEERAWRQRRASVLESLNVDVAPEGRSPIKSQSSRVPEQARESALADPV
jgi:hypothetical protein